MSDSPKTTPRGWLAVYRSAGPSEREAIHVHPEAGEWAFAEIGRLRAAMQSALDEVEDDGPKALKYAGQELRKGLAT